MFTATIEPVRQGQIKENIIFTLFLVFFSINTLFNLGNISTRHQTFSPMDREKNWFPLSRCERTGRSAGWSIMRQKSHSFVRDLVKRIPSSNMAVVPVCPGVHLLKQWNKIKLDRHKTQSFCSDLSVRSSQTERLIILLQD